MKTLPTPKWETVVSEAIRKGFSPESIVAYGYFGSLAVGTATEESDEDIFVIVDKPVSAKKKMNRGDLLDSKFFSCFDWVEDREGANCEVFLMSSLLVTSSTPRWFAVQVTHPSTTPGRHTSVISASTPTRVCSPHVAPPVTPPSVVTK